MKKLFLTFFLAFSLPLVLGAATVSDIELRIAALLSELQILQKELQNVKSGEAAVSIVETPISSPGTSFTTTLGKGSEGVDVTRLQQYLASDPTLYPEGLITGYFGALTEVAVKRFQQKYNIVSAGTPTTTGYGHVGPATRAKLNALLTSSSPIGPSYVSVSPPPTPYTPNTPNRSPNLSVSGERVVFLPNSASLSGIATDDGFPGIPLAYFWKKASGPGSVSFSSLDTPLTTATFSAPGTYRITLTVSDGDLFATYTIAISVKAALSTPTPVPPPAPVTPPVSTPTLSFSADFSSLVKGQSTVLTWSAINVSTCTAGEGWSGAKTTSGSAAVAPTQTTTYTLTCDGTEGDTVGKEVTITVTEPAPPPPPTPTTPTLSFSANATTLTQGQSTTLSWTSTNTVSCTASNGWTGAKSLQGSSAKIPSTTTTTYALTCANSAGESVSKSVTVTVTTLPPDPSLPVLGISGDKFTINGTPKFLLGVSYYDALGWRISDLNGLSSRGFNLIRVWTDWPWSTSGAALNESGDFVGEQDILDLIHAAAERGIIVDVTVLSNDRSGSRVTQAITQTLSALKNEPNVFFDLVNEHNCGTWSQSHSDMADLVSTARAAAGNAIITFSSACESHIVNESDGSANSGNINEEVATGIDLLTPHFGRGSNWYDLVDESVTAVKSYLNSINLSIPVYLQEEQRNGYEGGDFTAAQLIQAGVEARNAGAAGYVFHTDAGFDLSAASFFNSLDSAERDAVDRLSAAVF